MLSRDGAEHRRHRDPFAEALRLPTVRSKFSDVIAQRARALVTSLSLRPVVELRTELAGPLAVQVMIDVIGLFDTDPAKLLAWYRAIVEAVDLISAGADPGPAATMAMEELADRVRLSTARSVMLADVAGLLEQSAVVSNAAVMLFGGIETAEGMTSNALWFLLSSPKRWVELENPNLIAPAIDESLRLEPAAGRVDRYATEPVDLGGASIDRGDLVVVSLTAANRDPAVFPNPDEYDLGRDNVRSHLAFAQGPHACIGIHLARFETAAAIEALLALAPELKLDMDRSTPPSGLVFRKPARLCASLS
jgi:cytochrome P450